MAARKTEPTGVTLKKLARESADIEIVGTAPLIVHAWSQKAKEMMLKKQMGIKVPKEPKDPQDQYEESMYRMDGGAHGFPMLGFKAATVGGARYFDGVTMTQLRQMLMFHADGYDKSGTPLMRLDASAPRMREDMVRVGMGTADLRYRAEYTTWRTTLHIQYIPSMIDLGSIVALVDAGGLVGVGEWRPEKDGVFGTFEVAT